ncbi:hypothetical protein ACHQM5_022324 [Ranunculus cassubicifolius]
MGDSSKEEEEEIGSYNFYNPCYYLEMAAKGFLKCLGIDCISAKEENEKRNEASLQEEDGPSSTEEQEMKSSEDERGGYAIFTSTLRIRGGRPTKPPKVGTGGPPQHNSSSS